MQICLPIPILFNQILQLQRRLDSAHKTELDFVTEDMQLVLWLKATLKEDKELELYLFTETLIAMRVKKRRADGIVPLVPYGKPIPLGLLQVLDDATEGDKDCHVTLRSAEANFARNGSLRGTLTRRNSVHGKNSFTIKVGKCEIFVELYHRKSKVEHR